MALYAFDGTWNEDNSGSKDQLDTNVLRFCELYDGGSGTQCYVEGVGTRLDWVGKVFGGLFGSGGRQRIEEMYEKFLTNWKAGDHVVDIIGFSRGAALAVHFANKLAKDGAKSDEDDVGEPVQIRFLGVWDIVASFGLSFDTFIDFHAINLGWDVDDIADNVQHCFHAMALNERRESFGLTRLNEDHQKANIEEVWFRGVHSDIGGGSDNEARSNIALNWMLDNAIDCGLPIDEAKRTDPRYARTDEGAAITHSADIVRDPRREVAAGDKYHHTAVAKHLAVGESVSAKVFARYMYSWSGIEVQQGEQYEIKLEDPADTWKDGDLPECGADGWDSEQLPWFKEKIVDAVEGLRRCKDAQWFELIGALGDDDKDLIRLGGAKNGVEITIPKSAELYFFANDLRVRYGNNEGDLVINVKRTK